MRPLLIAISLLPCFGTQAAGYDCKSKNLTEIETMVCNVPRLSSQDDHLFSLYAELMRVSYEQERSILRLQQSEWLRDVRDRCTTPDCLDRVYHSRLGELANLYQERWQSRIPPEVLAELAKRSRISQSELTELLGDCSKHQLAMNICAFRSFVEADLEMGRALEKAIQSLPTACRVSLQSKQKSWEKRRDRKCNREADEEAAGGSMRPSVFSSCRAISTEQRTQVLRTVKSCAAMS